MKKTIMIFLSLALLAAAVMVPVPAAAAGEPGDITGECRFTPSSNTASFRKAIDGRTTTVWEGEGGAGQQIEIAVGGGAGIDGLYFRWDREPPAWTLTGVGDDGNAFTALTGGGDGALADYAYIPAVYNGCGSFILRSEGEDAFALAELSVYSRGNKPAWAPDWQTMDGPVDILLFSAHPDDEQIYLGSIMPAYAQRGRDTVTVFMTYGKPLRRFEAMESVWLTGEKICPVLGPFRDKLTKSLKEAKQYWDEDETAAFIVEQIRKYKPAVIATHDVKGEYGHGAHIMTSALVQEAFERSGDPDYHPASAEKYGAWQAAKLYIHLYKKGELSIDTAVPLPLFGGKTALEMAEIGYSRHVSQHVYSFYPRDTGVHSIRKFGLFATRVGEDGAHDDLFENIGYNTMRQLNPWHVDRSALSYAIVRAKAFQGPAAALDPRSYGLLRLRCTLASAEAVMADDAATQQQVSVAAYTLWQAIAIHSH